MAKLTDRLKAANSLLRSAYQIALREQEKAGSTNWKAFSTRVHKELMLEDEILHPEKKK